MQDGGGERADARRRQQRCMAENRPQRCLDFYLRAVLDNKVFVRRIFSFYFG